VIDHGNMPLGKLIYEKFWDSTQPDTLATFLESQGQVVPRFRAGAVLKAGTANRFIRGPIGQLTPPQRSRLRTVLYATTYAWSISFSGVGGTLGAPVCTRSCPPAASRGR